jgi:hypothetical protein
LVVIIAASGTGAGTHLTLASYAAGRWRCEFGQPPLIFKATVTVGGSNSGLVTISSPTLDFTASGIWSVRSSQLVVRWAQPYVLAGSTYAQPVSLNTKQFKIKSNSPGAPGQWIPVHVQRQAKTVDFSFPIYGSPNARLDCSKV